jgi:amidase
VRSTQGSPIFADRVPKHSDILVEHIEANGGIVYAMSNTPEFGAGANTFNEVFGATLNPWNTSRSAAGSSGGAAVSLATGMAWIAHGSDQGGSLRNPASFCGVTGIRPSIGRVARSPGAKIDRTMSVQGPMARNVMDLALGLDAMSGEHPRDPLSLPAVPGAFQIDTPSPASDMRRSLRPTIVLRSIRASAAPSTYTPKRFPCSWFDRTTAPVALCSSRTAASMAGTSVPEPEMSSHSIRSSRAFTRMTLPWPLPCTCVPGSPINVSERSIRTGPA